MLSHFHKDFPFNHHSSWLKGSYAPGRSESVDIPSNTENFINVNASGDTIDYFRKYYPNISENEFLRVMGQQATEYYLYKQTPDVDYIGLTTYRRYLGLLTNIPKNHFVVNGPKEVPFCEMLTSQECLNNALQYLQSCDIITNLPKLLANSVQDQYLESQPRYYWDLFQKAIYELYPEYREHLVWFTTNNVINFYTTYIMKREYFLKYAEQLFKILEYIFQNADVVYPKKENYYTEIWPWRYPGFLGERFMPFFVYANSMKKIQVPLVILDETKIY